MLLTENQVTSTNPSATTIIPSAASVPKWEMPESTYEQLPDTVLDFKKKNKIGRFDPAAPQKQEQKAKDLWKEVEDRSELHDA